MITIHKYQLDINDTIVVRTHTGARILSVQVQNGVPCIWALVDTNSEKVTRILQCRGTGHDCEGVIPDRFVGTFQLHGGALVFHLFDTGVEL